jgi:hypothetical protein
MGLSGQLRTRSLNGAAGPSLFIARPSPLRTSRVDDNHAGAGTVRVRLADELQVGPGGWAASSAVNL